MQPPPGGHWAWKQRASGCHACWVQGVQAPWPAEGAYTDALHAPARGKAAKSVLPALACSNTCPHLGVPTAVSQAAPATCHPGRKLSALLLAAALLFASSEVYLKKSHADSRAGPGAGAPRVIQRRGRAPRGGSPSWIRAGWGPPTHPWLCRLSRHPPRQPCILRSQKTPSPPGFLTQQCCRQPSLPRRLHVSQLFSAGAASYQSTFLLLAGSVIQHNGRGTG